MPKIEQGLEWVRVNWSLLLAAAGILALSATVIADKLDDVIRTDIQLVKASQSDLAHNLDLSKLEVQHLIKQNAEDHGEFKEDLSRVQTKMDKMQESQIEIIRLLRISNE